MKTFLISYILLLFIVSNVFSYKWEKITSPDSIFNVTCVTEMGQRMQYDCLQYEELKGKMILTTENGRITLHMGNMNSVQIEKKLRPDRGLPGLTNSVNLNSTMVNDNNKEVKSEIVGLLYQLSFLALTTKNESQLSAIKETLKKLNSSTSTNNNLVANQQEIYNRTTLGADSKYRYVVVPSARVRDKPNSNSRIVDGLALGTKVEVMNLKNGWYKILTRKGNIGYIYNKLVTPK